MLSPESVRNDLCELLAVMFPNIVFEVKLIQDDPRRVGLVDPDVLKVTSRRALTPCCFVVGERETMTLTAFGQLVRKRVLQMFGVLTHAEPT